MPSDKEMLDEALVHLRAINAVLRDLLELPEAKARLAYLDKGIGTKTQDAVWLRVRALASGVMVDAATDEAAFQRGKRRGYTDGYYAAEVAARPVLQDALDMLRTERYGNTDPDKRERTIERIERFINGAPGVRASAEPTDDDMKRLAGKIAGTAAVIQKVRGCSEREAVQRAIEAMEPPPDAGVNVGPAPDITDEELGLRFTRCAYPGPNPMYRCNGCGHEEYGVRNLLLEHAAACGVLVPDGKTK